MNWLTLIAIRLAEYVDAIFQCLSFDYVTIISVIENKFETPSFT